MNTTRRLAAWLIAMAAALAAGQPAAATPDSPAPAGEPKVLRYAFSVAETGFDPAQVTDLYSRIVTNHIFEGLYHWDPLARPLKVKPLTAAGMPEVSADYRTWTVRVRPGIFFAEDPAFKGKARELVAADYVYAIKRFADPANKSPGWATVEQKKILGLAAAREKALKEKKPFDYDTEIEGLRALDRYTLQFKLEEPEPRFIHSPLAAGDLYGAVAREVVEHYRDAIPAHPVGTGPFRLKQWRRSSLIVLERNPQYRHRTYDAEPAADDAEGQAILATLKGRRLPMVDRVEVSIIEESQPMWLSFLNGRTDVIERVPEDFIETVAPGGKLVPSLAKKGVQMYRRLGSDSAFIYYNMEDPVVGGYTPEKIALRRAMNLALDVQREIRVARRGQAIPAQGPISPHLVGYDEDFKSEMSDYDPARAKALLDMYGYVDRDGDGWREQPDGSPLAITMATQPVQRSRQLDELRKKNWDAIGVRVSFKAAKWPENIKAMRAGSLQMWALGVLSDVPDGQTTLMRMYGPQVGNQNFARFRNAEVDKLIADILVMPASPERLEKMDRVKRITLAYAPYKFGVHRIFTDLAQPWVVGYRPTLFWQNWWEYVDIDESQRPR